MKRIFLSLILSLLATAACAQTYNRFGPANGILVGNTSTPQTTAAAASNVISLWSGTCNASTFLRADGSCQAASGGAGTVTSVGLTVPSGLSVTGSPITTSGTLAISTTLNGLLRGTGTGFTTAASSNVISLWSGTCDSTTFLRGDGSCVVPGGGGGGGTVTSVGLTMPSGFSVASSPVTSAGTLAVTTTLNGVLRGDGSGITTAASSNIIGLWSGTCNASTYLRGDGSCVNALVSPAGFNTQIQFNNAGDFGADADFAWDSAVNQLNVNGTVAATTLTGAGSGITALNAGNVSSGTLAVARGGTGTTTSTGTGSVVLSGSPTFTGTVTGGTFSGTFSGNGAAVTSLNAGNVSSGTLPVARGGTGTTTSTGTGNTVLSNAPSLTGTTTVQTLNATGGLLVNGVNVCQSNGTNCPSSSGPKIYYGFIFADGSGCNVSGIYANSGLSGCSRTGTGSYNVSFSPAFTTAPVCTMSGNATGGMTFRQNTASTTIVNVVATNGSGSATDSAFMLHCIGP